MQTTLKILIVAVLLSMGAEKGLAQVWPGDINNNGIVNHIDLLYLGQALFESGPARTPGEEGVEWEEKTVTTLWPQAFPGGVNYVFADCDGDGFISPFDQYAIEINYGLTHGSVDADVFSEGMQGLAPPLSIAASGSIFENGAALMTLQLGTPSLEVNSLTGIAFTISYDPEIFREGLADFVPGEWIESGPGGLVSFVQENPEAGTLEIALSRIGMPLSGSGELGSFFIIIEDHVVGLETSIETIVSIKDVRILTSDFSDQPVFADSTIVTILNDDVISSTSELEQSMRVYPQPATDRLFIETINHNVNQFEVSSLSGKVLMAGETEKGRDHFSVQVDGLTSGMYLLKLHTDNGWLVKKIIVQ